MARALVTLRSLLLLLPFLSLVLASLFASGDSVDSAANYWAANSQLCISSLLVTPGSLLTITVLVYVEGWTSTDSRRQLQAVQDFVVELGNDATTGQLTLLKTTLKPNVGKPKLQSNGTAQATAWVVPAARVAAGQLYKLSYKYRVAKSVPAGTEVVFTLLTGSSYNQVNAGYVTVVQKKK